ncbi:MAG: hypothetical protein HY040_25060 [Planctomycetes bacterium]|nr:hypothetical protein [Planctomycetota bacterium]
MLSLVLILLLTTLALMLFLYVGALFLQGYFYTQPSETLFWGAPAAGLALGLFLALWCVFIVNSPGANPENIPYDTFTRFSPRVDMLKEPVKELFAVKKNGDAIHYKRFKIPDKHFKQPIIIYKTDQDTPQPWRGQGVERIHLFVDGEKHEFKLVPASPDDVSGYRHFVSDDGWIITEMDDGPIGIPQAYRWGRFFANLFLNGFFLALWFLSLWLFLRFQWSHALGLALCAWLVFTLALLPMILSFAASVAASSP